MSLFSKVSKRKRFCIKFEDLNFHINIDDREKLIKTAEIFDNYLVKIEEYAYSGDSSLQLRLRKEKVLDLVRAELLILAFLYFNSVAHRSKFGEDAGNFFTYNLVHYIKSLKIDFPIIGQFIDAESFFENRNKVYVQFWVNFLSNNQAKKELAVDWLESIISLRLFGEIKEYEINQLYYPDFNGLNQFSFHIFFVNAITFLIRDLYVCFPVEQRL